MPLDYDPEDPEHATGWAPKPGTYPFRIRRRTEATFKTLEKDGS